MKEFEELQQLWQKATPPAPVDFDKVMRRIDKNKMAITNKLWLQVIGFIIGLLAIVYTWVTVPFVTWTSHLALFIMILCIAYALRAHWIAYTDFKRVSASALNRPEEYISFLKNFKEIRHQQHTRSYIIYETCVAGAFALYSFELYFAMPLGLFIGFIAFIIGWLLLAHFVFLKAYSRNENEKIQAMIHELDRIKDQFNGVENGTASRTASGTANGVENGTE
jgi:hypothetical protein